MTDKFINAALRMAFICTGLLLFFISPQVSAQSKSIDLTNTSWKVVEDDASFVLTFARGKAGQKTLAATLAGWGKDPLEFRGEYSDDTPDARVRLACNYNGRTLVFNLKLSRGDVEQKPYLYGDLSTGSEVLAIYARCARGCTDNSLEKSEEGDNYQTIIASSAARELIGEWEDTSGEIGFKEYWSINFVGGEWRVTGKFVKGEEVVGRFQGEDTNFDSKKGTLSFLQLFDPKPDESWLASNDIVATAQGDKLKFKVRGVEAILTRVSKTWKPQVKLSPAADRD
jgi:hypothetical protein